jgi:hypothetical protein
LGAGQRIEIEETIMRALPTAIAAVFMAGCATAPIPAGDKIAVYDHRNMVTHYVYRSSDSDFVGTSAKAPSATTTKTSTYKVGHP